MTMCSGIGAPEVAAPWVDWRFASEIEAFPREVLQQRLGYKLPEDQNQGEPLLWGDMTEITPDLLRANGIPLPDLIVAGTPCQAFSIAGLRKGTADERGNLTLKFVEICHDIVAARPDGKLAVLWENVPGVLSDKGNAFGCFLGGLVGAVDALQPPGDGSWPGEGMVQGPRARAAWCVLDAQWFGVAQRRRRVFVVVDFGNCIDPAAILLEPDRLRGNTPPRRETGKGPARGFETGPHGGGFAEVAPTLDTSCKDGPVRAQIGAGVITARMTAFGEYACDGTASTVKQRDFKDATDLVVGATGRVTHALTAEGHDASEDGTGRGTPVVAFDTTQITSPQNVSNPKPGDACHPLAAGAHPPALFLPAVRRLAPTECHRLQGFPDDWCAITRKGKPAADGPQYKALSNSMAVPVIAWILDRLRVSWEQHS